MEHKAARGRMRKLALIWVACAALSWALTVVVGYSVMRFGEATSSGPVVAESADTDPTKAMAAEAEALSRIAPAAGTAEASAQ